MRTSIRTLTIVTLGILSLGVVGLAIGDDDDDEHRGRDGHGGWVAPRPDIAPVANATYAQECGACHLAYQPGLLPAQDWARIMVADALANHYGDDASVSDALRDEIASYLIAHSADQGQGSRSRAFAVVGDAPADLTAGTLPRITRTRYFVKEHDEIPAKLVTGNPDVGSFSQCNRCHGGAEQGIYSEKQVSIPGHGRWDD